LRPSCRGVEKQHMMSAVLTDANLPAYLQHVEDFLAILTPEFFQELRDFGDSIKKYAVADPFCFTTSEDEFELSQLSSGYDDYNNQNEISFIKIMEARKVDVANQLEAIEADLIVRSFDEYHDEEICPDWRDDDFTNYMPGTYYQNSANCDLFKCIGAQLCYDNNFATCSVEGDLVIADCLVATPVCDVCFPYSRCGGAPFAGTGDIVESSQCEGELYVGCSFAGGCFAHDYGECSFDGELMSQGCKAAEVCRPCFPNSRCGEETSSSSSSYGHVTSRVFLIIVAFAMILLSFGHP